MRKLYRLGLVVSVGLIIAACGTVATPRYEADRIIAEAQMEATHIVETAQVESVRVATATEAPTEVPTAIPPTETPEPTEIPPTATAMPSTATPQPTEPPADTAAGGTEAEIMAAVDAADIFAGETKFLQTGCTGCHMPSSDMTLVGPGLAGVFNRGGDRVPGQGPYEYIFTSIRNSQAFIVDGFTPGLMPLYTEDLLADQDIYNIMSYLRQFSQ